MILVQQINNIYVNFCKNCEKSLYLEHTDIICNCKTFKCKDCISIYQLKFELFY